MFGTEKAVVDIAYCFSMQEAMDRYYTSVGDTPSNGHIDLNSTPSDLNRVHIQNIDHYRHNHSKHNPQMNTHLNHNYSQNGGSQLQSIYKNRARSGSSDNTQDMTKVCTIGKYVQAKFFLLILDGWVSI